MQHSRAVGKTVCPRQDLCQPVPTEMESLTSARLSHECNRLGGRDGEGEVAQHLVAGPRGVAGGRRKRASLGKGHLGGPLRTSFLAVAKVTKLSERVAHESLPHRK